MNQPRIEPPASATAPFAAAPTVYWFNAGIGVRYRFAGAIALAGGIGIWAGMRQGVLIGVGGFAFFAIPLFLIIGVGFSTLMDVRLDTEGVAKIAFGQVWRHIAWQDIEKIALRPFPGGSNHGESTTLQIYPRQTRSFHRPRMVMGMDMSRADQFVAQLNAALAHFRIPVEDHRSGRARVVPQVVLT